MATKANPQTQFYINEDAYAYCPLCGAKHSQGKAGQVCGRSDLPPYIGKNCPGVLKASSVVNQQILAPPDKTATS